MTRKIVIVFLTLNFLASALYACRCTTFNFEEQLERSTYAFIGIVKEQKENELIFQIIKLYKGDTINKSQLRIIQSNSSCYKQREYIIGQQLLIYTEEEGIHNCSRTNGLKFNSDLDKLENLYPNAKIYDQKLTDELERQISKLGDLLINCGLNNESNLNDSEIEFLVPYLKSDKSIREFEDKNILFVTGSSGNRIADKTSYFNNIKFCYSNGKSISNSIIWLSDEMKIKSGGYDAVVTNWVKLFCDKQLEKIIKKAKKTKAYQ